MPINLYMYTHIHYINMYTHNYIYMQQAVVISLSRPTSHLHTRTMQFYLNYKKMRLLSSNSLLTFSDTVDFSDAILRKLKLSLS